MNIQKNKSRKRSDISIPHLCIYYCKKVIINEKVNAELFSLHYLFYTLQDSCVTSLFVDSSREKQQ